MESLLACPLSHAIDLSLHSGQIPEDMKNARVVPLYKKSKTEPGNYRPIPFPKTDFGNYIGMVMIDLQKAFDTVDHYILKAIGLDGNAIVWFDAYLTNRMQVTDVGGIFSDPRVFPCRVPQGSILGTLFFLIYVNDKDAYVSCKLVLYADDSALLVSGKQIKTIENVLGDNLLSLSNWLIDNKFSLHLGKTKSILFKTKHMLSKHSKLATYCGNNVITSKTVIRYLGVDLEQTLSGTAIVENILTNGNSRLKFLYRQAQYLNTRSRKLLTLALILCHFHSACSTRYSGLQKTRKHKLQILQNKTIRFSLDLSPGHI